MTVQVSLIQVDCSDSEHPDARIARVLDTTAAACAQADMVLLPELWHAGAFAIDVARQHQQPMDGSLVSGMRAVAADTNTWVYAGSFAETLAGNAYNTAVLIGPEGDIKATYRKVHLFGFSGGETTLMTAGEDLVVVDTPLGPTGLATCYDLRFPEMFRQLVDRGAQNFLVASGWPTRRIEHWRILARARAIENQAWMLACNQVGSHAGIVMAGHSMIVDPWGAVVAEGDGSECVVSGQIDPDYVNETRRIFPVLADRKL